MMIEIRKNDELLFAEGLICDGTRVMAHFRQDVRPGEVCYLVDLESHCQCGKLFKDHETLGLAIGHP